MVVRLVPLVAAAFLDRPARAQAGEDHVSVHWNAPQACPSEADLKRAIESNLGQSLGVIRKQPLTIWADVAASGAGYAARLRFESPSGTEERMLDHPECGKLLDAAALVIALAIDPERVSARQAPASSIAPEPPPAPPAAPTAPAAPSPASAAISPSSRDAAPIPHPEASSAPFQYPFSLSALVGGGALPGVGAGVGADFALSRGHFELGVVGRYWLPRSEAVPATRSAEISITWWAADLRACGLPWLGTWRLRLCAAAGGGDISGHGVGVDHSRTRHTVVPTLSVGTFLAYDRGGASPFVGVTGDWLLVRPRLGVSQDSEIIKVYESSALALSAVLGLTYRL